MSVAKLSQDAKDDIKKSHLKVKNN